MSPVPKGGQGGGRRRAAGPVLAAAPGAVDPINLDRETARTPCPAGAGWTIRAVPLRVAGFDSSAEYRAVISSLREADGHDFDIVLCDTYAELVTEVVGDHTGLVLLNYADLPQGEEDLVDLRRRIEAPIMAFVSGTEQTKAALRSGADYDLPKPFDPEVFAVAVEAVLRRAAAPPVTTILPVLPPFSVEDLKVYPDRRTVERDGRRQTLSQTEWQLFAFLVANPGRTFSRRELAAGAWGPGYTSRAGQAELYVSRVRRKVERDPQRPRLIETVRGRGYRLVSRAGSVAAAG